MNSFRLAITPANHLLLCAGRLRPIVRLLCLVWLVALLAGCGALINPYVKPSDSDCPTAATTLPAAVKCANAWSDKYRKALGSHAKLRSLTGISLMGLSGAALGHGITEEGGDTMTWLGVGGAIVYGSANWLSNKPAELAYAAGLKAISCALIVVQPFSNMPVTGAELKQQLDNLNGEITSVRSAINAARVALAAYQQVGGEAPVVAVAEGELSSAETVLAAGEQALAGGWSLLGKHRGAPQALLNAVNRIAHQVDAEIVKSQPDLQALPGIIGGLSDISGLLTRIPDSGAALAGDQAVPDTIALQADTKAELDALRAALKALADAANSLSTTARGVRSIVETVGSATSVDALANCGVDETKLAPALTVSPAGPIQISNAQDATRKLVVSGGRAPYMAELLESPVDKLAVSQPVPFGPRIAIEVKQGAAAGEYNLHVTDVAGNAVPVKLKIAGGSASPGSAASPAPASCPAVGTAADAFEAGLSQDDVFIIQRMVKSTADGALGDDTRRKICAFQTANAMTVTGRVDDALLQKLKEKNDVLGGIVEGAKNPYERSQLVFPALVTEIQRALGVAETGKLDTATRTAIATRTGGSDELSEDLVAQITGG